MTETLTIDALGARGDGIASSGNGEVFVPFALPGETVRVERKGGRAELVELVSPSPDRVEPACRHFGICGGCAVQHFAEMPYREWKRGILTTALARRGIDAPVGTMVAATPGGRRRVTLSSRRLEAGVVLGFNRRESHAIVDIEECPVASPAIVAALPALRELTARIAGRDPIRLVITETDSGLDIAALGCPPPTDAARLAAVEHSLSNGFARLTIDGEIVVEARQPTVRFNGVSVAPPPGGFLQAVADIEAVMAAQVSAHLAPSKRIVDLFAGSGAFALRLAANAALHAVEAAADSLAALDDAARGHEGLKAVSTEVRDLDRRPLTAKELAKFDGLVFDPPRAGAEAQCRETAKSDIPLVAAVSCDPSTLARDLRILQEGGYRVESVTPYDQFLWSPHVEAVALLSKPRRRKRKLL